MNKERFTLDCVVHPGETLKEELEARFMTQDDLALRTGLTAKHISEIINQKAGITSDVAIKLEMVLGITASFWNNLDSNYSEFLARKKQESELKNAISFLKDIPYRTMIKRNWIPNRENKRHILEEVFKFLGFNDAKGFNSYIEELATSFRLDNNCDHNVKQLAIWLRKGEIEGLKNYLECYNKKNLENAFSSIKELSKEEDSSIFIPELKNILSKCGISFVVIEEFDKTRICGSARWFENNKKALIQLSGRGKTNDRFWFNLFHEIGHIYLNHSPKKIYINLSERGFDTGIEEEKAADRFAANILIDHKLYEIFEKKNDFSEKSIKNFAEENGVAPAIVLGKLQHHKKIRYDTSLNHLKVFYTFKY